MGGITVSWRDKVTLLYIKVIQPIANVQMDCLNADRIFWNVKICDDQA